MATVLNLTLSLIAFVFVVLGTSETTTKKYGVPGKEKLKNIFFRGQWKNVKQQRSKENPQFLSFPFPAGVATQFSDLNKTG